MKKKFSKKVKKKQSFISFDLRPDLNVYVRPKKKNKIKHKQL
ncbi:hypothetical protein MPCS_01957 (plasmid) [Candidatus Megaera polyxenophila]|nr:hypothetical protein MPCS_01957 [Candidatus Megaera polyxenophila]